MAIPATPAEIQSPLYKYYERDIAPTPPEIAARIMKGNFPEDGGLHPSEMNRMFDDGYLKGEFGYFRLFDGGMMLANLTPMPGVTPEMFDWWFAWHGLNTMRYKIWDKDDHYYCQTRNPEVALDNSLPMRERYWNTTHDIKESLTAGDAPRDVSLTFVPPATVGFDPERLKSFKGTIVCTPGPAIMAHFVRPTATGCELRTRFWFGYMAQNNRPVRIPDFNAPDMAAKVMLMHNVKEFTHLAKILPEVYAEFRDNFAVEPI